jgi:uncharacterized protein YndB with AHSA1/START domain
MNSTVSGGQAAASSNGKNMHSIERKVVLRAPRNRVWHALTDVKKFCEWFGVDAADGVFTPGAKVHMSAGEAVGGDFDIFVQQMQPEDLFSWRWHPGARDPNLDYAKEPTTLVVFQLADVAGGTSLTITETGFDDISLARRARVFGENSHGWDDQLANLERYVNQAS